MAGQASEGGCARDPVTSCLLAILGTLHHSHSHSHPRALGRPPLPPLSPSPPGSGKTHTIIGTEPHPGLLPLAIMDVFAAVDAAHGSRNYDIRLGILEIYNEE